MKTKSVKLGKPKKDLRQANNLAAIAESQVEQKDGFEKSRPLSRKEIAELKKSAGRLEPQQHSRGLTYTAHATAV